MVQHARSPEPNEAKLSAELRRRLQGLPSRRLIRVIVFLEMGAWAATRVGDRQAAIRAMRAAARSAKRDLEPVVIALGGHLLPDEPDALGSLGAELPVAGLPALAESDRVKAILEDQHVTTLPRPRR